MAPRDAALLVKRAEVGVGDDVGDPVLAAERVGDLVQGEVQLAKN
jgi:hypothetical protein